MNKPPIASLTGLRFIAAMVIAITHMLIHIFNFHPGGIPVFLRALAYIGMPLFFILSGFVIFYNYGSYFKEISLYSTAKFLVNRIARIYPLFIIILIIDGLLLNEVYMRVNGKSLYAYSAFYKEVFPYYLSMSHTWFYKIFGSNHIIYSLGTGSQISWSVSTEFFFYLCFPLIAPLLLKIKKFKIQLIWIGALYLILLFITLLLIANFPYINEFAIQKFGSCADYPKDQSNFFRWLLYFSPYLQIFNFMIGCGLANLFLITSKTNQSYTFLPKLILRSTLVVLGIMYFWIFNDKLAPYPFQAICMVAFFTIPIAVIIYYCARYNVFSKLLTSKLFIVGGECSYSIYLLHIMILKMIPDAPLIPMDIWSLVTRILLLFSLLLLLMCLSYGSLIFLEQPAKRFIKSKTYRFLDYIREKYHPIHRA